MSACAVSLLGAIALDADSLVANALVANLLVDGIVVSGGHRFLLILPLCLSISVVYKTTRCESLREVPMSALVLWVTIVVTMYAVGLGLWLLFMALA